MQVSQTRTTSLNAKGFATTPLPPSSSVQNAHGFRECDLKSLYETPTLVEGLKSFFLSSDHSLRSKREKASDVEERSGVSFANQSIQL